MASAGHGHGHGERIVSPFWADLLPDVVLVLHLAFAGYNVFGLLAIWVGRLFRARFVHNPWFRVSHLAAMGVVVAESLLGLVCPLTSLEYALRAQGAGAVQGAGQGAGPYGQGFLHYWSQRLFYHDWDPAVFTVLYVGFFVLMVATAFVVPIHWRRKRP